MGSGAGLDGCEKCRPHRNSIPGRSNPQQVAIPLTLYPLFTVVYVIHVGSIYTYIRNIIFNIAIRPNF